MRGKIFYHGGCFDGATSAALFAAFYRARHIGAELAYRPMAHSSKDPFRDEVLDGDDNICVDFRYCADPRMNWWFDHHVSAFQPRELRSTFDAEPSEQKIFDPTARSCAVLIERSLRDRFGFALEGEYWSELVMWADKIDGAQFASAREAVELGSPALEVMTWLAHNEGSDHLTTLIDMLGRHGLAEIAEQPWIRSTLEPILADNHRIIELIKSRSVVEHGVVFYDLTQDQVTAHNKFIAYMLFPESHYTVGVTSSREDVKVSVGFNPWAPAERTHNIAHICERYGGGGHPVVGGVSRSAAELERGREIANEIVSELRSRS